MSDSPVTDLAELAAAWGSVGPSVERRLRRAGVDVHTAADVAQEVACRAVARIVEGQGFTSRRGLLAWSHLAARNVAVDAWRRGRTAERYVPLATAGDEYEVVEWRDLLRRTLDAAATLTPAQRAALAALVDGRFPDDKRDQVRESVQRIRARERLRRVVGRLVVVRESRRWLRWVAPTGATAASVVVGLVAPGVPSVRLATGPAVATSPSTAPVEGHESVEAAPSPRHPSRDGTSHRGDAPHHVATTTSTLSLPGAVRGDRVPLAAVATPTSEVEVGTRPDRGRHVLCIEAEVAAVCIDKPRRTLGSPTEEPGR